MSREQGPQQIGSEHNESPMRRPERRRSAIDLSYRALGEFCDALSEGIPAVEEVVNRYPQFPRLRAMFEEGRAEGRIPVPPPDEQWADRMRSETLSEFERVAGYARLLRAIRREPRTRRPNS